MPRRSLALALVLLSCGKPPAAPAPSSPSASRTSPSPTPTAPTPAAPADEPAAQSLVHGRLLGHDATPMPLAQVALRRTAGAPPIAVDAGPDGRFELRADPGLYTASFTGVGHVETRLSLLLDGAPLELTVKLATHAPAQPGTPVVAHVWRTADGPSEQVPLTPGEGGRLAAELDVPAGEVRYQLSGHVADHTTNGTRSDAYENDGGGDYKSVVRSVGGKVRLEYDPAAFPPIGRPDEVEFADPTAPAARIAGLVRRLDALNAAHLKQLLAAMQAGTADAHADPRPAGWSAFRSELAGVIDGDAPPPVRRAAQVLYFAHAQPADSPDPTATALARKALAEVGPTDPLWALAREALPNAVAATGAPDEFAGVRDAAIDGHPDPELGASLLVEQIVARIKAKDEPGVRRLYTRLQAPRFAGTATREFAAMYDPDRPLAPGRPAPAIDLELLDPPAGGPTRLDLAALRGRPVLLDFWATWCTPCIAEMPELHDLKRRHGRGPHGLEIVSISLDPDPADVRKHRRGKWKMPWLHAVVPADRNGPFQAELGIIGIPVAVLLDAEGKIVASSPDLALPEIPAALAKLQAAP